MKAFGFESGKKAFHDRVVVWIGFAARETPLFIQFVPCPDHGSGRATRVQKRLKLGAGVLNAAIGMMEQPGSEWLIEAGFFPRSTD